MSFEVCGLPVASERIVLRADGYKEDWGYPIEGKDHMVVMQFTGIDDVSIAFESFAFRELSRFVDAWKDSAAFVSVYDCRGVLVWANDAFHDDEFINGGKERFLP